MNFISGPVTLKSDPLRTGTNMNRIFKEVYNRLIKAKRPFHLTTAGWIFILYTIGIGAGAINTGNNLLYLVFGIFLGLIFASGLLSDLCLWRMEVKVLPPSNGEAGRVTLIPFQLRNKKGWFPAIAVVAILEGELNGKHFVLKKFIPYLASKEEGSSYFLFQPPARGLFKVRCVKIATRFPFGLLFKWWTLLERDGEEASDPDFFIYPETFEVNFQDLFSFTQGSDFIPQTVRHGDGNSPMTVREYRAGDSPKRIHWKATAKRLSLAALADEAFSLIRPSDWLVREMETDERAILHCVWPSLDEWRDHTPAESERFIALTASIIKAWVREGKDVSLWVPSPQGGTDKNFFRIGPLRMAGRYQAMMEFLALFDAAGSNEKIFQDYVKDDQIPGPQTNEGSVLNLLEYFKSLEKGSANERVEA